MAQAMIMDGISVDLGSIISKSFQIVHSLKFASPQNPPTYSLAAVSAGDKSFLHATIDHDANVNARLFYNWQPQSDDGEMTLPNDKTKIEMQLSTAQQSLVSMEHEHVAKDYSVHVRAINPNPLDKPPSYLKSPSSGTFTGIFSAGYMQRIRGGLFLGAEFSLQKPTPDMNESCMISLHFY